MLIAEELLLLCLDDVTGRRSLGAESLEPAVGAAVVELALKERIGITAKEEGWRQRGRITITSTKPTDDPVLDEAMAYLVEHEGKRGGPKVTDVISPMTWRPLTKGLQEKLLTRLAAAGVLSEERGRVLGVFPMARWPTVDTGPERAVREQVRSALVDGLTPTERTAALIALLHATGHLKKVLPGEDKQRVKRRAGELAEGDWAGKAVGDVIVAIQSVMIAAAVSASGS